MKNYFKVVLFSIVLIACQNSKNKTGYTEFSENKNEWKKHIRESITKENITYFFNSYITIEERENAIKEVEQSIQKSLKIIHETDYTRKMDVEFLKSREEMKKFTGMAAQGMACFDRNVFFAIEKKKGLIQHEIMHMVAFDKWGHDHKTSRWINEGFATYVGGICFEYTFEQIYKYLLQSKKVISMELLANEFYKHNDMITYTESAFISKYLIDTYGLEKFKSLWKEGYKSFKKIYGVESEEIEEDIRKMIEEKYPEDIEFNWEEFNKGC